MANPGWGRRALIRGTPWAAWVEFPRSMVVAPARVFLARMALIGLVFILAAAVVARAVSARITTPLHDCHRCRRSLGGG